MDHRLSKEDRNRHNGGVGSVSACLSMTGHYSVGWAC